MANHNKSGATCEYSREGPQRQDKDARTWTPGLRLAQRKLVQLEPAEARAGDDEDPLGAGWFTDLYRKPVWGAVNVGLLFALSQFAVLALNAATRFSITLVA